MVLGFKTFSILISISTINFILLEKIYYKYSRINFLKIADFVNGSKFIVLHIVLQPNFKNFL